MNPEPRLFINGELCEAENAAQYVNISPVTEQVIGQAADASPADMERAITAGRQAFDHTVWSTYHTF